MDMWHEFFRFGWMFFLCMGLYPLMQVPRQEDETRKDYLRKPRTIISVALLIAVMASGLHMLIYISTKHTASDSWTRCRERVVDNPEVIPIFGYVRIGGDSLETRFGQFGTLSV